MPRYKLTIAYEGTDFCGWQKQTPPAGTTAGELVMAREPDPAMPEGAEVVHSWDELRTVQAVVERAVRAVVREPVEVAGASRTDSGVHARGQVAAFTCTDDGERGIGWPLARGTDALVRAINSRLSGDVLVLGAEVVDADFNPIRGAVRKRYTYTIWNDARRPLWERRTALHVYTPLDIERMNQAARVIEGEHDFAAFAAAGHGRLSTVRRVFSCEVRSEAVGDGGESRRVEIGVEGNGFLWNMVRIIAGTLVEAGKGRMDVERIREALATGKRELAGPTLPPHGLCLEWIRYA